MNKLTFFTMPKDNLKVRMIEENTALMAEIRAAASDKTVLPDAHDYYNDVLFPDAPVDRPYTMASIVLSSDGKMAFADNSTRYSLINDIMNDSFKGLRDFYYEYHRLALDNMAKNVDNARAKIAEKIPVLRELNRKYPGAAFINAFLNAKNDELINIFAKFGTSEEKRSVHEILVAVNPTLVERYNLILE